MVLSCFSEEEEKKSNQFFFFLFCFVSDTKVSPYFFLLLRRNEKNLILDQRSEEILGPKTDQNKKNQSSEPGKPELRAFELVTGRSQSPLSRVQKL